MPVGQVFYWRMASGTVGPGGVQQWFQDNRDPAKVRWFIATPVGGYQINGGPFMPSWDQKAEVSEVFHLLKGGNHDLDGTGGTGTLQVNIIVRNLDKQNPLSYDLMAAETF